MAATASTQVGGSGRVGGTFLAAAAPTGDNDETVGYHAGDCWIDTTNHKVYFCENAADGAAVWTAVN